MARIESGVLVKVYNDDIRNGTYLIPQEVTDIGDGAFYKCRKLTSVTITEGVKAISDFAFSECMSLTSVAIPKGVRAIGNNAFMHCISLTSVTIPEGVTVIGDFVFYNCSSLTSLTIPEGVTAIGNYAFNNCRRLTSVAIPKTVTAIGCYAFSNCSGLTSVIIPEGVMTIGGGIFSNCSGLTSLTIPASVNSIHELAFLNCSSLTSLTIPEGVTAIGDFAFSDCSSLTSVTISKGVTAIGKDIFFNCHNLTTLTIPASVNSMHKDAFLNCPAVLLCKDREIARFTSLYPEGSWIPESQAFEVSPGVLVCKDKYYEDLCEHYPNIYWVRESMHNKRDKELFDGFARTKPWCQIKGLPSQVVRYSTEETLGLRFATMKAKLHSLPLYASGGRMEKYNRRVNATIDFFVEQEDCVFKLRTYMALAEQVLPKDYSTRITNQQDNKAIAERLLALKRLIERLEALPLSRRITLSPKTIRQFHDSEIIESILQAYPEKITFPRTSFFAPSALLKTSAEHAQALSESPDLNEASNHEGLSKP